MAKIWGEMKKNLLLPTYVGNPGRQPAWVTFVFNLHGLT